MAQRWLIFLASLLACGAGLGRGAAGQGADPQVLAAEEIVARLARRGYREVAQPVRRGQIYLVEATDQDGSRRVLVITVTEALIVGDGPATRSSPRSPLALPTTAARE